MQKITDNFNCGVMSLNLFPDYCAYVLKHTKFELNSCNIEHLQNVLKIIFVSVFKAKSIILSTSAIRFPSGYQELHYMCFKHKFIMCELNI